MHPTTSVSRQYQVPVVVLVGPPAAGKTTVSELFDDIGAYVADTDELEDGGIYEVLSNASSADVPVCCIDGNLDQGYVDGLREIADGVLVVRVDAPDGERHMRHVEREFSGSDPVSLEDIRETRASLQKAEQETAYARHQLTLENGSSVETTDLIVRLDELCQVLLST